MALGYDVIDVTNVDQNGASAKWKCLKKVRFCFSHEFANFSTAEHFFAPKIYLVV